MSEETIASFVDALNDAWRAGRVQDVGAFYHEDAVLLPPDLGEPIIGRQAIVATYADFVERASLERFDKLDLATFGFGAIDFAAEYAAPIPEIGKPGYTARQGYELFAAVLLQGAALAHYFVDSFIWRVSDETVQEGL